jgi:5-methyltetrahydropteroyltriglutamate--homocysteine methyltransferase
LTVEGFKYAQSLTPKVVKGQLPGPTTLLRWSYPAVEIGIKEQTLQLALCLRDEVRDLEIAGAKVIEVNELGFREGLPLRGQKRVDYLAFVGEAFRLATSIAGPHIEIHTHVAYTEVEDCVPAIQDFDADVYLFENTRAHDTTLRALQAGGFQRRLGLGCFDVHCPVIPSVDEILQRLRIYADAFSPEQLVVVPDGPLRTRSWEEVQEALTHMCQAAVMLREEVAESRRLKIPGLGLMNEKGSYGSFSGALVGSGGGGGGGGGRERTGSFSSPAGSPR